LGKKRSHGKLTQYGKQSPGKKERTCCKGDLLVTWKGKRGTRVGGKLKGRGVRGGKIKVCGVWDGFGHGEKADHKRHRDEKPLTDLEEGELRKRGEHMRRDISHINFKKPKNKIEQLLEGAVI